MSWFLHVLRNYAVFTGRASRKEYWMYTLIYILTFIVLSFLEAMLGLTYQSTGQTIGLLSTLFSLGVLLPSLGVTIRRLHDTGRSGWWILLAFIPVLGAIALLIFLIQASRPGAERFGAPPATVPA